MVCSASMSSDSCRLNRLATDANLYPCPMFLPPGLPACVGHSDHDVNESHQRGCSAEDEPIYDSDSHARVT